MSKSLFRFIDRAELLSCYLFCFIVSLFFDYTKTLNIDSPLLQYFLKQFYDYQIFIVLLVTVIVIIFHYQIVVKKRNEIYIRIIIGDTINAIRIRYVINCLQILLISFVVSIIFSYILNLSVTNLYYLFALFILYTLASIGKVKYVKTI